LFLLILIVISVIKPQCDGAKKTERTRLLKHLIGLRVDDLNLYLMLSFLCRMAALQSPRSPWHPADLGFVYSYARIAGQLAESNLSQDAGSIKVEGFLMQRPSRVERKTFCGKAPFAIRFQEFGRGSETPIFKTKVSEDSRPDCGGREGSMRLFSKEQGILGTSGIVGGRIHSKLRRTGLRRPSVFSATAPRTRGHFMNQLIWLLPARDS